MIIDIVQDPAIVLHQPHFMRDPIALYSEEYINEVISNLLDTAANTVNCVGLAANQINESASAFIYLNRHGEFQPVLGPFIHQYSQETFSVVEGCLSLESEYEVIRHKAIYVSYVTPQNRKERVYDVMTGFEAQIFQHEYDHLKGILVSGKEKG